MKKEDWIQSIINSHQRMETVAPAQDNFSKILVKINQAQKDTEPFAWIKIAAIFILSFSVTQAVIFKQDLPQNEKESTELVSENNNLLYE